MTKLRLDMESIAHKIENRIKGFGRGKIFFADDFLDFGSSDAIRIHAIYSKSTVYFK